MAARAEENVRQEFEFM